MSQGESHYDLYASLGLDREKSAAEIAGELDSRLERLSGEGKTVADPAYDEASTARTILGDPRRRRLYDERLASPTPPAIGIDELRGLAQLAESALPPLEDEDEKDAPSAESPADAYYGQQAQQPYADPATEQYPAAGQQQPLPARRARVAGATPRGQGTGGHMGIPRRQDRSGRDARGRTGARTQRGAWH